MFFKRKTDTVESLRKAFEEYLSKPHIEKIEKLEINFAERVFKVNGENFGKNCTKYQIDIEHSAISDLFVRLSRKDCRDGCKTIYEYNGKSENSDISINSK